MLEMRPTCECCDTDLPASRAGAMICSFECTYCTPCAENVLGDVCPNCCGGLTPRPTRMGSALASFPASTTRIV